MIRFVSSLLVGGREPWAIAVFSATVAILLTPVLQPGLPVLTAALGAIIAGSRAGNALAPLASAATMPDGFQQLRQR